jgi:hypothetical protein
MLNVFMLSVIILNVVKLSAIMLSVIILNFVKLSAIMLSVIILNVVKLNVIMLSVIILNVVQLIAVMLSVMAPYFGELLILFSIFLWTFSSLSLFFQELFIVLYSKTLNNLFWEICDVIIFKNFNLKGSIWRPEISLQGSHDTAFLKLYYNTAW